MYFQSDSYTIRQLHFNIEYYRKPNQSVRQFIYCVSTSCNDVRNIECCGKTFVRANVKKHLISKEHHKKMIQKFQNNDYTELNPITIGINRAVHYNGNLNYVVFKFYRDDKNNDYIIECNYKQRFKTIKEVKEMSTNIWGLIGTEYDESIWTSIGCLNKKIDTHKLGEPSLTKHILKYMIQ